VATGERKSDLVEVESTERWIANKSEVELLSDLKVYLAHLRDNPRSIPDRMRVAAIQLKLGRTQEALIHYEGVLRGYAQEGRIMSAIALCKRILALYPELPRIQRILAALYARAPHGATLAPTPVTPIVPLEEQATTSFVLEGEEEEAGTDRNVVVDRVFPEVQARREALRFAPHGTGEDQRPTSPYPAHSRVGDLEEVPTRPVVDISPAIDADGPAVLLTTPKRKTGELPVTAPPAPDDEMVVLLTKPKKKR